MTYICPVCGYDKLTEEPYYGKNLLGSYEICLSCGFEFGYSDDGAASGEYPLDWTREMIIEDYRQKWINDSTKWWAKSLSQPRPEDWSPKEQLKNIGINI